MMYSISELKHVMIDTETLGLTPGSVIRTVSVVEFNPVTGETGRKHTWTINLQDSIKAGFRIEAGTLKWWMMKSDEARTAFVSTPEQETGLVSFVNEFIEWFKPYAGKVAVWGLQIDFDLPMIRCYLHYMYMQIMRNDEYPLPWNRHFLVDARPFVEVYRENYPDLQTPHTSMGDCLMQIDAVAEVFKVNGQVTYGDNQNMAEFHAGIKMSLLQFDGVPVLSQDKNDC